MVKKKTPEEEPEQNEKAKNNENINPQENPEAMKAEESAPDDKRLPVTEEQSPDQPVADKAEAEEVSPEEKLEEIQDKYIRLSAEFDNYRKRTLREKIDLSKYSAENLIVKLLPVMDDFERALSHMEAAPECAAIKEGIDLIYTKFTDFLNQNGVKEIESIGCAFDVDLHHAVAKIPVEEDAKKGRVVEVVQKGYYLHDKVIRHSKVVIGE